MRVGSPACSRPKGASARFSKPGSPHHHCSQAVEVVKSYSTQIMDRFGWVFKTPPNALGFNFPKCARNLKFCCPFPTWVNLHMIINFKNPMHELREKNEHNNFHQLHLDSTNVSDVEVLSDPRPKYGRMIVIFENERFLITIGPDWWCFAFAFFAFLLLEIFTVKAAFQSFETNIVGFAFLIGAIVQELSYVAVAISNPGIATEADFDTEGEEQAASTKKYCRICNLPMLPKMRHCKYCGVCIKGYDHHCPWTSKCIGAHNIGRFYLFACWTPLYLLLCFIMLVVNT